jgi:hypothetical protein
MKPTLILALVLLAVAPLALSACSREPTPEPPKTAAPAATPPKTEAAKVEPPPAEPSSAEPSSAEPSEAAAEAEAFPKLEPINTDALKAAMPAGEPAHIFSYWQSLYLARRKIGYMTQSLGEFPDHTRRLETNSFLKTDIGADKFGYIKMITADVDEKFRPKALDCRIICGARQWRVRGIADSHKMVLTRTVDDTTSTIRIPIDDDVTFLSWTLMATLLGNSHPGTARHWMAIDESLGAVLPDPCIVQLLGQRQVSAGPMGQPLSGSAVLWACGLQQVAHLAADDGRILRSIWQSAPIVGEGTSLGEARQLTIADNGPKGPDIEGLGPSGYRDGRRGFGLWVPPYPYVVHAAPELGAVEITNLVGEAHLVARLAAIPQPMAADTPPEAVGERVAEFVQNTWATRYEDVKADSLAFTQVAGHMAFASSGTARLGCTTLRFRNYYVPNEGRLYSVSITVADRATMSEPVLTDSVVQTFRLMPPEGPLPLQIAGDLIRSPYYGFELRRPNKNWSIPNHIEGPTAALEMARQDQAAVVLVRILGPKPGQSLESFAADQAKLAALNLSVPPPEPKPAVLDGRRALEIAYEGKKILSDRPAHCTIVYTSFEGRVLALTLIAADGADESAAKDLQQIRDSLKFLKPLGPG